MKTVTKRDQPRTHKHMVKKRHTRAYDEANARLVRTLESNPGRKPACECGSDFVRGIGGHGVIELFCAECNTLLQVKDMSHERFGDNMTDVQKDNLRQGLCEFCGHDLFFGKLIRGANGKYVYQYYCERCRSEFVIKEKAAPNLRKRKNMGAKAKDGGLG
jgi:superfamily II helicase